MLLRCKARLQAPVLNPEATVISFAMHYFIKWHVGSQSAAFIPCRAGIPYMVASAYYSIGPAIRDYQRKHVSTLYLLVPFSKFFLLNILQDLRTITSG